MKIGYNEATARDCSTLEEDLKWCEELGFDYIEIRMDLLRSYLTRHPLSDLKKFFASSRLKPHAMNAFYLYPEFLGDNDDPVKRQALLDEILLGFVTAKEIGAGYAIVVAPLNRIPGSGPYQGKWDDTFRECVRMLRTLSDIAAFYSVKICFELVGTERCSVRTVEQADEIVKAVDRDNVGFVFDSYNLFLYDQNNDFSAMRKVAPEKIFAVHINQADDVPVSEMGQDKRRFCGPGVMDLRNFLENLKTIGYSDMVSIETFRPEYWQEKPEWVIREAYRTTRECMKDCGVL